MRRKLEAACLLLAFLALPACSKRPEPAESYAPRLPELSIAAGGQVTLGGDAVVVADLCQVLSSLPDREAGDVIVVHSAEPAPEPRLEAVLAAVDCARAIALVLRDGTSRPGQAPVGSAAPAAAPRPGVSVDDAGRGADTDTTNPGPDTEAEADADAETSARAHADAVTEPQVLPPVGTAETESATEATTEAATDREAPAPVVAVIRTMDGIEPMELGIQGLVASMSATPLFASLEGESSRWPALREELEAKKPDLWVAVGRLALRELAASGLAAPVVFMFVATPERSLPSGEPWQVAGVTVRIDVARQLHELRTLLPDADRIGVLFDPRIEASSEEVARARQLSGGLGLSIMAVAVTEPGQAEERLQQLLDQGIDALWLVPDRTVMAYPPGADAPLAELIEGAARWGVPVVGYAPKQVEAGALFAVSTDYRDLGVQTAEIVERILAGAPVAAIGIQTARTAVLTINSTTANELGIVLPYEAERRAAQVYR